MSTDLDPEVYKVIGAPGTGKTTKVVGNPEIENHKSLVQKNLENYDFEEQMIVTYTNAAVDEAADRLERIVDEPRYKIDDRVTTIHSECFSLLNLSRDNVVGWWDKKKFCDTYDMTFEGGDDEDDIMSADKPEGNSFFDIYGWLKSNRKDHDEYEQCPQEWSGENDFRFLAERWEDWKDENDILDFSDMIERVVERGYTRLEELGWGVLFPTEGTTTKEMFLKARDDPNRDPDLIRGQTPFIDAKVLYVDEVQDLTPLQWEWYLLQKLAVEKAYIGGDDDQTIYGWAGANPEFMLGEEGDFEVLDKTYRIPREVWEVCDGVIRQVDKRQEKDVQPHGDGGAVHKYRNPSTASIIEHIRETDGRVFILLRARFMVDNMAEKLIDRGVPFNNMSTYDTWNDEVIKVKDALYKLYRKDSVDEKLSGDEVQALKDNAPEGAVKEDGIGGKEKAMANWTGVNVSDVEDMFTQKVKGTSGFSARKYLNLIDDKDKLNYYQKTAVKNVVVNDNANIPEEKVNIGTIHSSKGREAETVILGLDTTNTIAENIAADVRGKPDKEISDAERRVYYVGMTRSSDTLVLAEGLTDSKASLELKHLLDEEHLGEGSDNGRAKGQTRF